MSWRRNGALLGIGAWLAAVSAAVAAPDDPTFKIILDRGVCFGSCPVYSVEVDADGQVVFHGGRSPRGTSVACQGERRWRVGPGEVARLEIQVDGSGFLTYRNLYNGAMDLPVYAVTVTRHGQTKTVSERGGELAGMPAELVSLQRLVDEVAGTLPCIDGPAAAH